MEIRATSEPKSLTTECSCVLLWDQALMTAHRVKIWQRSCRESCKEAPVWKTTYYFWGSQTPPGFPLSPNSLPVPLRAFILAMPTSLIPCMYVVDYAYTTFCDPVLPEATQLCWAWEDFFYSVESFVKYLLLLIAYLQPKLVESGGRLVVGIYTSNLSKINQQKEWLQLHKVKF